MTDDTPHGQVPEALNQLFEKLEDCIYEWSNYVRADDAPTTLPKYTAGAIKDLRVAVAELYHRALRNAHVQNPAEQGAYETGWKDGYKHGAWSAQLTPPTAAPSDAELYPLIEKHFGMVPRRDDTVIDRRTGRCHDAQRYRDFAADLLSARAQPTPPAVVEPTELSPDFTDTARAALLWVLWHHQGGSSPVGQPIRFALGMGKHDRLNEHQLAEAKRWERLHPVSPSVFPRGPELLTDGQIDAIWKEKPRYHAAPIGVTDIEFARDIEAAAHGIGIKNGDGHG